MTKLHIVQVTQIIKRGEGFDRLIFPLGIYSSRDNAMLASAKHAIEVEKKNPVVKWEATGQSGYTENCTYVIYVRSVDTDCLEVAA